MFNMSLERPGKDTYIERSLCFAVYQTYEVLTRAGGEGNWCVRNLVLIILLRNLYPTLLAP